MTVRRRPIGILLAPIALATGTCVLCAAGSEWLARGLGDGAAAVVEAAATVGAPCDARGRPGPEAPVPDDGVDYDAVVRTILGDAWATLTEGQRVEVRALLGEVVRLAVQRAREQPADVRVAWVRAPDGGRIVDVVTEGSSLVRNYRVQIAKLLGDPAKGYPLLVERLRRKIARAS